MNRWTGTGHLTKDPKFLETDGGTAICALRIAVKRAGKQGNDGYFDVKCFDGQAHACADYLKAGREVAIDGRLLFDEFQTQDGSYASRVYIVAERVEFLASAARARAADNGPTGRQAGRARRRRGWRRDRLLAGGRAIEIRRKQKRPPSSSRPRGVRA
jgi:single-strand DNA-binding protein